VFDVVRGLLLQHPDGAFATVRELTEDSTLATAAAGGLAPHGLPYARYMGELQDLQPVYTRMESQKPLQRIRREIARAVGAGGSQP
jgi:hypothetical protein